MDIPHEEEDEVIVNNLLFQDDQLQTNMLVSLNMMRKSRHFCDVILHVGSTEIHAHRAILASVSQYLFEMFSNEHDQKTTENVITYKLNGGFDKNALLLLVDYAYTAVLEVPFDRVKAVYLAACKLKIDRVARQCAQHLIKHLSIESCIEIRSLPGIARNREFIQQVDAFIASEFECVSKHPNLLNLYCAKIEILNQSRLEMTLVNHNSLCRLVLEWIKRQLGDEQLSMLALSDKTFMLYLAIDNSLQDCTSLPTGDICDTDMVQDYKKLSLKNDKPNNTKGKRKSLVQPSKPRVLIYSREIGEELDVEMEPDWNLITSSKVAENNFLALVTLAGKLATLSIQLRLNVPSTPSPIATPVVSRPASEEKPDLYCVVPNMSCARCAVGCGNLNNTLVVCGGYDRIECLRTVEQYFPETNTWKELPKMRENRGRFQIAIISNIIYAIGGSNGTTELETAEMLDMSVGKWKQIAKLPIAKSNSGVCALNGLIYCIGGWNGQVGIKQCDVYNPELGTWTTIAPLNVGRYQAAVTSYNGQVYAIGGCDSWNCLSAVEVFNPNSTHSSTPTTTTSEEDSQQSLSTEPTSTIGTNAGSTGDDTDAGGTTPSGGGGEDNSCWLALPPLITARRGCGAAVFRGRLHVVGGSDGSHALATTECYDDVTQTWLPGPSMTTARGNVECAVVGGRLYAVGGFSGKNFLNTIEYLDENSNEWTTFIPKEVTIGDAPNVNGYSNGYTNGNCNLNSNGTSNGISTEISHTNGKLEEHINGFSNSSNGTTSDDVSD